MVIVLTVARRGRFWSNLQMSCLPEQTSNFAVDLERPGWSVCVLYVVSICSSLTVLYSHCFQVVRIWQSHSSLCGVCVCLRVWTINITEWEGENNVQRPNKTPHWFSKDWTISSTPRLAFYCIKHSNVDWLVLQQEMSIMTCFCASNKKECEVQIKTLGLFGFQIAFTGLAEDLLCSSKWWGKKHLRKELFLCWLLSNSIWQKNSTKRALRA